MHSFSWVFASDKKRKIAREERDRKELKERGNLKQGGYDGILQWGT